MSTEHQQYSLLNQADAIKEFAKLNPRAFDSYVQQFDRTVSGQDQVISTAQYSGYLQFKAVQRQAQEQAQGSEDGAYAR